MASYSFDAIALELLLTQALAASDQLEYEQVGAHLATALDALRREKRRAGRPARLFAQVRALAPQD